MEECQYFDLLFWSNRKAFIVELKCTSEAYFSPLTEINESNIKVLQAIQETSSVLINARLWLIVFGLIESMKRNKWLGANFATILALKGSKCQLTLLWWVEGLREVERDPINQETFHLLLSDKVQYLIVVRMSGWFPRLSTWRLCSQLTSGFRRPTRGRGWAPARLKWPTARIPSWLARSILSLIEITSFAASGILIFEIVVQRRMHTRHRVVMAITMIPSIIRVRIMKMVKVTAAAVCSTSAACLISHK